MPRTGNESRTIPSILDRLLDDAPTESQEASPDHYQSVRNLKAAVQRDLEALLNTRQEALGRLAADFPETGRSILSYGLPDFSSLNLTSQTDRTLVRRTLEQAIAIFEPRLARVRITLDEPRGYDRGLHFHIEAMLRVQPAPEPVAFDAVLQLATQECRVQGHD